jgi:signal peptidase I
MEAGETNTGQARPRTGLATISLALGLISLFTLGLVGIGAIASIISGAFAIAKFKRDPARYGGRNLALAGIILGGVSLLSTVPSTLLIMHLLVQPVRVEGTAMAPTLGNGDRIFVGKQIETIDRGDIVVFWFPDNPSQSFMKRVVGLPGETLKIDPRGQLFINGEPVAEPYLDADRTRFPRPVPDTFIKPHYYFVMGDNRDASNDSRSWGLVPEKYIWGKFLWRYSKAD